MDLKPGEKPGPYEILSRIGEGGMGEVWKARVARLGYCFKPILRRGLSSRNTTSPAMAAS